MILTRMQAIETAKRMVDAGWNVTQVRDYLAARGVSVGWGTVKSWVDEDYAERRRAAERKRGRDRYRRINGVRPEALKVITTAEKLDRLRALRDANLSCSAVAAVIRLDFGDELTEDQVRLATRTGRYPPGRKGPVKDAA